MAPSSGSAWQRAASVSAVCFSFLVFGLEVNLLGPTAIDLAAQVGVLEADLGCIFMVNGLISILGAAPSGWMTDNLPGHMLLAGSLLLQAVGLYYVAGQTSLFAVAAVFGSIALTWNIVNTAGNVLCLQQAPEGKSTLMVNLVNALFGVGALFAPLLAEAADRASGSTLSAYPATAALTAVSGLVFLLLPSPPTPKALAAATAAAAEGSGARAPLLGGSEGEDGGGGGGSGEQEKAGSGGGGGLENPWALGGPLSHVLVPAAAFVFLSVGLEVAFGGWTTVYATKYLGQSEAQGHALTSAYWLSFTAGRIAASAAASVARPGPLLLATMPLAALGAGGALLLPAGALACGPLATAAVVLVGLGVSTGFANLLALLEAHAPVNGSVTGLLGGCAGAGTMLMPLAVALFAKSSPLGYQGLMVVTLVSMLLQFACLPPVLAAPARGGGGREISVDGGGGEQQQDGGSGGAGAAAAAAEV